LIGIGITTLIYRRGWIAGRTHFHVLRTDSSSSITKTNLSQRQSGSLCPTPEQKAMLERLSPHQVRSTDLAGEKIQKILTQAPGNGAPIGGIKVMAATGWFAAFRI
jgi:hypothetical protein